MRKQSGMQLFELLLVLCVASILLVAGVRYTFYRQHQADMANLQATVNGLLYALNHFYAGQECRGGELFDQSLVDQPLSLQQIGFDAAGLPATVKTAQAKIVATNQWQKTNVDALRLRVYQLQLTLNLSTSEKQPIQRLASSLRARVVASDQLQWQLLPNMLPKTVAGTGLSAAMRFGDGFLQTEESKQCAFG